MALRRKSETPGRAAGARIVGGLRMIAALALRPTEAMVGIRSEFVASAAIVALLAIPVVLIVASRRPPGRKPEAEPDPHPAASDGVAVLADGPRPMCSGFGDRDRGHSLPPEGDDPCSLTNDSGGGRRRSCRRHVKSFVDESRRGPAGSKGAVRVSDRCPPIARRCLP